MKRTVYALMALIFFFQIPCYLVFAEKKDNIKITGVDVNVEGNDSYKYTLNCVDNNEKKDTGGIKVYSPYSSEWKVDLSSYHDIKDKMPHYNLETINYGKTEHGRNTVKTTKMTVYPCEVLSEYDSGLWKELLSSASEEKPDILQVITIKGREALIVGEYEYDKELLSYSQNTSGAIRVDAELGVSIDFEVYFHVDEFDYMGNLVMMTRGSGYSSYRLPDTISKGDVAADVVPVDEILIGLKANVDSYLEKALQIPKNTEIKVYKAPFSDDYEYKEDEGSESELVILSIPGPGNTIQVVVGTVIPGIGIIIISILNMGTPPPAPAPVPEPIVGPTGIKDGVEKVLKGKTDGREYNIKYDAKKDEWTNTDTGNIFLPERFEGWQQDLEKDWQQSSKEREKMSNRDTEFDREVKKSVEKDKENAELLKKLHHLKKSLNLHRTEAGRINRPPGEPGSMTDKINELEDQLANGGSVDKELLQRVQRVYTKASNGDILGYNDLPKNSEGKEFGDGIELIGKEIFSGSSKKALVLRGLMAVATGGATEMGMEIASAGFVIKDYVDRGGKSGKGGDSVVEGFILAAGNVLISEGTGRATAKSVKFISKKGTKVITNYAKTSENATKVLKTIDATRNAKFNYKGVDIEVGLNDKMIKRMKIEGGETFKNIYVAPPFQNVYKSFFY